MLDTHQGPLSVLSLHQGTLSAVTLHRSPEMHSSVTAWEALPGVLHRLVPACCVSLCRRGAAKPQSNHQWLQVPEAHIERVDAIPDIDAGLVTITVQGNQAAQGLNVSVCA